METKKYELVKDNTILVDGNTLYRIKALKDFSIIKKGYLGGYVQREDNLSQYGDCWVYSNAKVYGNAKVHDNAKVFDNAIVYDNARVYDNTEIFDNAKVYGNAMIFDNARVFGNSRLRESAMIRGNAHIFCNAEVRGNAKVYGKAEVCGNAKVYENAKVFDNAIIRGDAMIGANAEIKSIKDYIIFKNWWSSGRTFTWTRSNDMWRVGCFYGTGDELIKKAYADSEESGREYERIVNYVNSIK